MILIFLILFAIFINFFGRDINILVGKYCYEIDLNRLIPVNNYYNESIYDMIVVYSIIFIFTGLMLYLKPIKKQSLILSTDRIKKLVFVFFIFLYHRLYNQGYRKVALLLHRINYFLTNADISPSAIIGNNVVFAHFGSGTVIGDSVVIQDNVIIYHNVTLGRKRNFEDSTRFKPMSITVGSNTLIGTGAIVLSDYHMKIGENVDIGAGAIVLQDVLNNSIIVGYNKVIKKPT